MQLDAPEVALALSCAAIVLWLLLTYGIFKALTVIRDKPTSLRASTAAG